jgi:hypothetical protein
MGTLPWHVIFMVHYYNCSARYLFLQEALADYFPCAGRVLASTVAENKSLMQELFGAHTCTFQPSIPRLVSIAGSWQNALFEYNTSINI